MSDTNVDKKEVLKNNTELEIKKKDTTLNDVIDLTIGIGNDSLMKDWNDGNWSLVVLKDQPFELIDLTESEENVVLKHFLRKSKKHKQHKHHPSKLSAFKESFPISNYFRNCFGLEHNMVTSGYKLKDEYRDSLLNYILKKHCNLTIRDIETLNEEQLQGFVLDIHPEEDSEKFGIKLQLSSLLRASEHIENGWFNDEILNLLVDSLNLHLGFEKDMKENFPATYVMNGLSFNRLYHPFCKIENMKKQFNINMEPNEFENNLRRAIVQGLSKTPLATLMEEYRSNEQQLQYVYGYINYDQTHFIFVVIDLLAEKIISIDPKFTEVDGNNLLARKWISKIVSIINHLVNNQENCKEEINYNCLDMRTEKELLLHVIRALENSYKPKKKYMFQHMDLEQNNICPK